MSKYARLSAALLFAVAPLGATTGCYAYVPAPEPIPASTEPEYEPLYDDDDHVVYFNDEGRPVYYVNGVLFLIPPTHPRYSVYVDHYHHHSARYYRWYRRHGHSVEHRRDRPPGRR